MRACERGEETMVSVEPLMVAHRTHSGFLACMLPLMIEGNVAVLLRPTPASPRCAQLTVRLEVG